MDTTHPTPATPATIVNKRGLHARAASRLAKLAQQFAAVVQVQRGDMQVAAHSVMGLLTLGASTGTIVHIAATGPQAEAALQAVLALIARGFDEDDETGNCLHDQQHGECG